MVSVRPPAAGVAPAPAPPRAWAAEPKSVAPPDARTPGSVWRATPLTTRVRARLSLPLGPASAAPPAGLERELPAQRPALGASDAAPRSPALPRCHGVRGARSPCHASRRGPSFVTCNDTVRSPAASRETGRGAGSGAWRVQLGDHLQVRDAAEAAVMGYQRHAEVHGGGGDPCVAHRDGPVAPLLANARERPGEPIR